MGSTLRIVELVTDNMRSAMYTTRMAIPKTYMRHLQGALILLFVFSTPLRLVHAQDTGWLDRTIAAIKLIINTYVVPTLVVLALGVFLWGAFLFVARADDEKARSEGKQRMAWGVVGLFVVIGVWGLVALLTGFAGVAPMVGVHPAGFTAP
jgi:hypothetical protein